MDDFDVDSHWRSTRRLALVSAITGLVLTVGSLVFVGWVIVKVMQHFGVL